MNLQLLFEFTIEEIRRALSKMQPLKVPGPDGFSVGFYQRNWATIGGEVCNVVLCFLNSGQLDEQINVTNIAIIPKIKNPTQVTV